MKQVLHIFAKDTRRFWPEILLSLAALAALIVVYPMQWNFPAGMLDMEQRNNLAVIRQLLISGCSLLVLICWAVLVARVIQEEPLVGDRQFWTTRPYDWKSLLAAKLLFLAVYLYPPLVAAQWICIWSAGVNPLTGVSSIAVYLVLLTGLVVLPVVAIASVTVNPFKSIFTVVATLLCGFIAAALWFRQTFLVNYLFAGLQPWQFWNAAISVAALCALVIVLQYATRRTALARIVLVIGVVALGIGFRIVSTHADKRPMPSAGDFTPVAQAPFQITFTPTAIHPILGFLTIDHAGKPVRDVRIPMTYAATGNDAAMHLEMFDVDFQGADGFHWSGNQGEYWPRENQAKRSFYLGFFMPTAVYDHLKREHATVRLTLYYDELQIADTARSTLYGGSYDPSGTVHCSTGINAAWLMCRTAAPQVPILNVNADFSTDPCPPSQPQVPEGAGPWWSGFGDNESIQFNLVPLRQFVFTFARDRNSATAGTHLCSGAPITFTRYRIGPRLQAAFTIPDLQLPTNQ